MIEFSVTRLPNGARVASARLPHVRSVALGIWIGVGGRHEPLRFSGASHFIEHLLFKGTATRSAIDISRGIEGRGGYLNAYTQEESTCLYARVASRHLDSAFDILSDMVFRPSLDRREVDRERGVIVEEILMYRDEPSHVVDEVLGQSMWHRHALGRPISGEPATILNMRRTDLLAFWKRHYVTSNMVFAFAGDVDHADCVERVKNATRRRRSGKRTRGQPVSEKTPQVQLEMVSRPTEQAHMALGVRLFGRRDDRRHALRLMNVILGENMSSRLFQVVRERHGLAYSIQSSGQIYSDTGALLITAGVDRRQWGKALGLTIRELKHLRERRVSACELAQAQDYVIGQVQLGLESTTNQMSWLAENLLAFGRVIPPSAVVERIKKVTVDDVLQVAHDVLVPSRLSFALVGDALGDRETDTAKRYLALLD